MTTTKLTYNRPENIRIADYDYELPEEKIALFPAQQRDQSKLLLWKSKQIEETVFEKIADFLPDDAVLFFNDTKVFQARLVFEKQTGSRIEIFCLEPVLPKEIIQNFQSKQACRWKCFVGNNKRWKEEFIEKEFEVNGEKKILRAKRIEPDLQAWIVEFSWNDDALSFSEVLQAVGNIPLPPYIHRENVEADKQRYQTVYANEEGSVAAPTAGLHFTEQVMTDLRRKKILTDFLTLHVGAGTFKPVSTETVGEHEMHEEKVLIKRSSIQLLLDNLDKKIIPVGTTSMRTIESIYWFACKYMCHPAGPLEMNVNQWDPYDLKEMAMAPKEALNYLLKKMDEQGLDVLTGQTSLMIAPPYQYRIAKGLITNFHQPKSTLLLLVSALIGKDWKKVYDYALTHDFRFLSYGDSCLFLPEMREK